MNRFMIVTIAILMSCLTAGVASAGSKKGKKIIHDAEYAILEAQNGEQWAEDDKAIEKKLADLRKKNGGKPPNIVYILLDDVGFGEIGMDELSVIRGYKTPHMSKLAKEGMSLQRMYTEPSCTPTRVAMMTGRYPTRTGTTEAKATLAGDGLNAEEVTIAEVLKDAGYFTSHVGKWHLGDIEQAYASNQGFMHAEFPIHQQGQLAIMGREMETADIIRGVDPSRQKQTFTLDKQFVPDPAHMVTGVELRKGKLYEVEMKPGEAWTQKKYREMNERYQKHALSQLRTLARQDKPFFLNYWPLFPLSFVQEFRSEYNTLNGGTMADILVEVDEWIGDIVREVDTLGIAENTVIIVMGDNGPFLQYQGPTGQSDRIYRGGKTDHLEGGVRVNAWAKWKGVIEAGSFAEDIIHVSDLFTTFARLGNAMDGVPRDRVIDGVDQSGVLLLGESHGRRDYVHIYEGPVLKSVVKNKYKMHIPNPGDNPIRANIFDLYRDSREQNPIDAIKYGPWAGGQFAGMVKRHMAFKQKYPDRPPVFDIPYKGIENLRPESKKIVEIFMLGLPQKK
ncbi:sulfatase-like hydrolase/transferase [Desulfoluna spongiiphila]|uniref:sulfatase-like hydrolase/transferase n=1 Tax=Desulfoluna spongiiphila TaxID=419481 RepID=UPI001254A925|nr:sulfatase-like hydrolase/transferase [Desulfoluna spongiiphila]VVS91276.1 prokaryotic membrane lipoprotein lipid attachment site profile [Desulfoluna spongiiphila]